MNSKKKILIIPIHSRDTSLKFLEERFAVEYINMPSSDLYLQDSNNIPQGKSFWEMLNQVANRYRKYPFSAIVTNNTCAFLWASLMRTAGFNKTIFIYTDCAPYSYIDFLGMVIFSAFYNENDIVVSGCQQVCDLYHPFGIQVKSLFFSGTSLEIFKPASLEEKKSWRNYYNIPEKGKVILYTGRGCPNRNLLNLVAAKAIADNSIKDLYLIFSIIFPNYKYIKKVKKISSNVSDISFFENIRGNDLRRLYCSSDLFVVPDVMMHETFGRSPHEALACGIPVIVPYYNGYIDQISKECSFKIKPALTSNRKKLAIDPYLLSNFIIKSFKDLKVLREKGRCGPENERRFEMSITKRSFLDLISSSLMCHDSAEYNTGKPFQFKIPLELTGVFGSLYHSDPKKELNKIFTPSLFKKKRFNKKERGTIDKYIIKRMTNGKVF